MTEARGFRRGRWQGLLLLAGIFLFVMTSPQVMEAVRRALWLCADTVIPSLFPFMVLSDLLVASLAPSDKRRGPALLGIPPVGWGAFALGALCGFPIGVKYLCDLYRTGRLQRGAALRLLPFVNNSGPAFVIAGIGLSLFSSLSFGLLLYAVQLLSALLCGILFFALSQKAEAGISPPQKGGAVDGGLLPAIRRSATAMLGVCAAVVFFSAVAEVVGMYLPAFFTAVVHSLLEVGGASRAAADMLGTAPLLARALAVLALCFGGFSVHLQAQVFLAETDLPFSRYLAGKAVQAALALLLFFLLSPLAIA